MSDLPWFPLYVKDFLTSESVRLLSNEEVGIYLKLLCHQWIEGTIPADEQLQIDLSGWRAPEGDENFIKFPRTVVERLFKGRSTDGQRWFNERLEQIRSEQDARHSKREKAARLAGLASAKARRKQSSTVPNGRATKVQPSTNGRSTSVNHIDTEVDTDTDTEVKAKARPASPSGPPAPPQAHHKDFHRVSWAFYEKRKEFGDEFFNPWDPKNLHLCQRIVEKLARGNLDEVRSRFAILQRKCSEDTRDFWHFTPGDLASKWDQLGELKKLPAPPPPPEMGDGLPELD